MHMFATELQFAHAALDLPEPDWGKLRRQGLDPLFEVAEEARGKLQEFVAKARPEDWEAVKELRSGKEDIGAGAVAWSASSRAVGDVPAAGRIRGIVGARFDCERCDGMRLRGGVRWGRNANREIGAPGRGTD